MLDRSTFIDRPFGCPLDTVVNLPPPPSVNKTRRVNWAFKKKHDKWIEACHSEILAAGGMRKFAKIPGRFEVTVILDENLNGIDLDNSPKHPIDYCRLIGLVVNDNPKHMRRVVIEWGEAPTGCRLILRGAA